MALKFLNKKGWHTGSLRNIENVWKAEQKHEAEKKKLEELKKQIQEERERSEFRQLQEQAGLIPRQERLEFLYDSGLAVGKGGTSFKELDALPSTDPRTTTSSSSAVAAESSSKQQQSAVPGALFEDKPQTANDSWRKLHSDPLLLIRQKEQEALARVKNNPVQMAMIRKSVEAKKLKEKDDGDKEKKHKKKHHHRKSRTRKHSSSGSESNSEDAALAVKKPRDSSHVRDSKPENRSRKSSKNSDSESSEDDSRRRKSYYTEDREFGRRGYDDSTFEKNERQDRNSYYKGDKEPRRGDHDTKFEKIKGRDRPRRTHEESQHKEDISERQIVSHHDKKSQFDSSDKPPRLESNNRRRNAVKLTEEERAARLREMQMDAERHEQQRWKRLKKAEETESQEKIRDSSSLGRNFLDAAHKSVYGAEKGGSTTIEESVRRRSYYSQGRSESDRNAFRR